jgi:hypothetical protein
MFAPHPPHGFYLRLCMPISRFSTTNSCKEVCMPDDNRFLQTEEAINGLLAELSKLKSAAEQIGTAKESAVILKETADNLLQSSIGVIDKGMKAFELIEETKFKERFDELDSQTTALETKLDQVLKKCDYLDQRAKTVEKKLDSVLKNGKAMLYFASGILLIEIVVFITLVAGR